MATGGGPNGHSGGGGTKWPQGEGGTKWRHEAGDHWEGRGGAWHIYIYIHTHTIYDMITTISNYSKLFKGVLHPCSVLFWTYPETISHQCHAKLISYLFSPQYSQSQFLYCIVMYYMMNGINLSWWSIPWYSNIIWQFPIIMYTRHILSISYKSMWMPRPWNGATSVAYGGFHTWGYL